MRAKARCEHPFAMTSKGSIGGQLQRALKAGDLYSVRSLAGELPSISLERATQITLLILEQEPASYDTAARRLLARLAMERKPSLSELSEAAQILNHLQWNPEAAKKELFELVRGAPR
jgi:hypothetical protein